MQCPKCKTECPPGAQTCPQCGAALENGAKVLWGWSPVGKLAEEWPRGENGDFIEPVFLTHCTGLDMQDEMLANMLSAFGIPSVRQYPNDGSFGRVILGMSGSGVDLYVPQTLVEDALALISEDCRIEEENDEL